MEFLRAGEALFRSSQPLLPFLAPSACRPSTRSSISRCRPQQWHCQHSHRALTTSHTPRQQSAAAARRAEDENSPSLPSRPTSSTDEITSLLDGALDGTKGVPTSTTSRTSRFKTPGAQKRNRLQDMSAMDFPPRAQDRSRTIDADIAGILDSSVRNTHNQRQNQTQRPPLPGTSSVSPLSDVASAFKPSFRDLDPPPLPTQYTLEPSPIKLNSSVGRSIPVSKERGVDVGRAFRMLEMRCAQNSVRRDFQRQRFHERAGLKRKRLKSERWRRRFKEDFKATIGRVQKMRRMGW